MTASLARVLGFEQLDMIEDVIQDALLKALKTWPYNGMPDNPSAWLIRVAKNRAIDIIRRDKSWSDKQVLVEQHLNTISNRQDTDAISEVTDEQLHMVFACCHPAISGHAHIALTLKSVCGFSVDEIASAFLTRKATIAQRLVRAKRQIRQHDIQLELPGREQLPERLESVLKVIYLLFNEGYGASAGNQLIRHDLCAEALRLCQCVVLQDELESPQAHALMALLYLQSARLTTRMDGTGDLILLADQDRTAWDVKMIQQGVRHMRRAAAGSELSSYHLQAEISACHTLAPSYHATDWPRILDCYNHLYRQDGSVVTAVNRVAAMLHAEGPEAAQLALDELGTAAALENYYPYYVTRAAIAGQRGLVSEQREYLQQALQLAGNAAVKRFLIKKLAGLGNE